MRRTPPTSWLVIGGVAAVLVIAGVDALRSEQSKSSGPTASTQRSAPRTTAPTTTLSTENFAPVDRGRIYTPTRSSPRIRTYVAEVTAICAGANDGLRSAGVDFVRMGNVADHAAAAAAGEWALTNIRALPPPQADGVLVNQFLSAMEKELDVVREIAAAASGGEGDVATLQRKRIDATRQKGDLAARLAARWRLRPRYILAECPVGLPA
jgi:hypothetical protein